MKKETDLFITHPNCRLHEISFQHPECPERLTVIEEKVKESSLNDQLTPLLATPATREQLLRVHTVDYIENLFRSSPKQGTAALDPDTAMNPYTLRAALLAVGAVVQAVDLLLTDKAKTAFCCVRPPGHHAEHDRAMGFCFFNNIAVGVAHAMEKYRLKRVAILDFDVHQGNGTVDIFQDNPNVLYCSTFQYPFYPMRKSETESAHIINIPLTAGTDAHTFRKIIEKEGFAAIDQFKPELLFVSAGFDAHKEDPLANLLLAEEDYAWLGKAIKNIADQHCNSKLISVLEGGYALDVLGQSVVSYLKAIIHK